MLAQEGVIMSNFHTSPLCAPSRAMLLSGNDNHIAGIGIQAFSSENFGYEGKLSERVKIIPEVLQKSGYKSFISGKWHIGGDPYERGFNNSTPYYQVLLLIMITINLLRLILTHHFHKMEREYYGQRESIQLIFIHKR